MYPMIYAALGAAAAYYGFPLLQGGLPSWPRLVLILVFLLTLPVSLCRVLGSFPPAGASPGRFRRLDRGLTALTLGLCLGMAAAVQRPLSPGLPGEKITGLYGRLEEDPRAFADGRGMGSLALSAAMGRGGLRTSAAGTLPVFFPAESIPRLREFGRGAELYLEGAFLEGPGGPLFRAAAVHIVRPAPDIEQFRTALRLGLLEKLSPGDAAPGGKSRTWGPLAAALLLGVRDNLDTEMARAFQDAGCSHVLALSGMHLAILSAVIAFFLRRPLGLKAAAITGGVLITAYVYLAGAQPSLVRSAIMYLLGVLAVLGNLKSRPLVFLALAFLIQIFIQPRAGLSLSFILSYLALGGILLTGQGLHEMLRGRFPGFLAQGLSASVGAFLATAAVTSLFFGILRPVGILAGLVITPLTTIFMIGALGVLVLGFAAPFLTGPPGMVLSFLAELQNLLVSLAARVPGLTLSRPLPVLFASLALSFLLWYGGRRCGNLRKELAPFD